MKSGKFHADNGDAVAVKVGKGEDGTANLLVGSDGSHGSGLDEGWNTRKNVQAGPETGQWTPDE